MSSKSVFAAAAGILAISVASNAYADEGMWTFDAFPAAKVKEAYGWAPDQAWLNRIQNASVRLSSGCSSSLVSSNGLILTNHHCIVDCVQNFSTPEKDMVADGFYAVKMEEERKCPGLQAEILTSITDVTGRIQGVLKDLPTEKVSDARNAEIARIESGDGCKDDGKTLCEVVSLYQGGQYKLYRYRKYADVRLAFAPELNVGFFGGDPDNFNFPRYAMDSAFIRLYEDGRPVATPNHLTWTAEVPKENELVFVSGNPGSTSRLDTNAELAFRRDWVLPTRQLIRAELRGRLLAYMAQGAEQTRQSRDLLFGIENSYKAQYGQMRALMDPEFFGTKVAEETSLRQRLKANAALSKELGDPWADIEKAVTIQQNLFLEHDFLEARAGSVSGLYGMARTLVRAAAERTKPNAERLPGFTDSAMPQLERFVMEETPVYPAIERLGMEVWLMKAREYLTVDSPAVKTLLGKESPEDLAARLIAGTKLADPKVREALWKGGAAAIAASDDPLIQYVRRVDGQALAIRKQWQEKVDGPLSAASARIAKARFALDGDKVYPDATFTLRLSYGAVKGWTYNGVTVPPFTDFAGLKARATDAEPFKLVPRWAAAIDKLNPATTFNISSTNDIIGGNSGSPLIDKQGRVVGAVFDGNIHSLGGDFGYDGRVNRTVTVSTAAVSEALVKVYGATRLATELGVYKPS